MKRSILAVTLGALFASQAALAQTQNNDNGATGTQQIIGDVDNGRSSSNSTLINPSAASNGNDLSNSLDNRIQVSPNINPNTTSNALGANLALGNNSSASNGPQSMGQANTGNSSIGNTSATNGPNTLTNGPNTNTNSAAGGVGHGGQGGGGGNAASNAAGGAGGASTAFGGTSGAVSGSNAAGGRSNATGGTSGASSTGGTSSAALRGGNQSQGQQQGLNNAIGGQRSANSNSNDGVRVDASDKSSYSYKSIFIPPVVPPTPPSTLAVGNIIKETSACGPLQRVIETKVEGTFHGFFFDSKIEQGKHQELTFFTDEQGNIVDFREVPIAGGVGYRLYGHQVTQYTAIVGVSGARNLALGGGGGNGDWGQAGGGASSSMQQLVTTLQLRSCEYAAYHYQAQQPLETFMTKRIRN